MKATSPIATLDNRLYPLLVAPVAVAFWLLGLTFGESALGYAAMAMFGWVFASMVWWWCYRRFVLLRRPPSRSRFYLACVLGEAVLIGLAAILLALQAVR